jgi:hypothetical protein
MMATSRVLSVETKLVTIKRYLPGSKIELSITTGIGRSGKPARRFATLATGWREPLR